MGQDQVLAWLQEHPGWYRRYQIAAGLGKHGSGMSRILKSLVRWGEIQYRVVDGNRGEYRYPGGRD